jgi:hypothetical protein
MANITSLAVGSTTVGANYQKPADPFAYGIRDLTWIKVQFTGIGTNPTLANSVYAQTLRGLQNVAEVWFSATTAANFAVFAVSAGTLETKESDDALTNGNAYASIEAAIEAVTGNGATITTGITNVFKTS